MGNVSRLGFGLLALTLAGVVVSTGSAAADDGGYTIARLPVPAGAKHAAGLGINSGGTIAGSAYITKPESVKWSADGTSTVLARPATSYGADAHAVNDNDVVIGKIRWGNSAFSKFTAAAWAADGTLTELKPLPNWYSSSAQAVNTAGVVAGYSFSEGASRGGQRATLWGADGTPTDLGFLPEDNQSTANGINADGVVAGDSWGPSSRHAVRWDPTSGAISQLQVPGGAQFSYANGINDLGAVVGSSVLDGNASAHAALWGADGGYTQLAELPGDQSSEAYAINNAGVVAGRSCDGKGACTAVTWEPDGTVTALGFLPGGDNYSEAHRINDAGVILGHSRLAAAGDYRYVTWTPVGARR